MNNKIFDGMFAKFKSQYLPVRDTNLGIYLPTGDIAKAVKPENKGDEPAEYRVFIGGVTLTSVPAAFVSTRFPVFRISKPVNQLAVGDIIRTGDGKKYTYRIVREILPDGRIKSDSFGGTCNSTTTPINDLLLGASTVSVVINFMKAFAGGQAAGGFNPMMLAFMSDEDGFGGGDDDTLKSLCMMSMMGGQGGFGQGFNPMMLAFMGNKGGDSLQDIMMMSMMCQPNTNPFGNFNPFANLFPTPTPVATAPAAATAAAPAAPAVD